MLVSCFNSFESPTFSHYKCFPFAGGLECAPSPQGKLEF